MNDARHPRGIPTGGQFAPSAHSEPAVGLATAKPLQIIASVELQQWQGDNAMYLRTVEFDATQMLAKMTPEDRAELEDGEADDLFETAVRQGLVADHDGPFDVRVRSAMDDALEADPDFFEKVAAAPVARHENTVLDEPLTPYEMGMRADVDNRVTGRAAFDLDQMVDGDLETHLDSAGNKLVGSELLQDISITPVAVDGNGGIICEVSGDASAIIDDFDEDEMAAFEAGKALGED